MGHLVMGCLVMGRFIRESFQYWCRRPLINLNLVNLVTGTGTKQFANLNFDNYKSLKLTFDVVRSVNTS